VNVVEMVQFQDCAVFQLKHLTETAVYDGIEDRSLGRVTGGGGILCERVTGRENGVNPDTALGSITVVLELQTVSMQRLLGVGVISCGRSERGQSETGSLEIHKSLKCSRRLGSLGEPVNPRDQRTRRAWRTSLLLVTHPLTISGVNSSTKVLSCEISVQSGPEETIPMLGPKRVSCFFGGLASLGAASLSWALAMLKIASCRREAIAVAAREVRDSVRAR